MGLVSNAVALMATVKGVMIGVALGSAALVACEARRRRR